MRHRGHKTDPLDKSRRLLTMDEEHSVDEEIDSMPLLADTSMYLCGGDDR